MNPCVCVYRKVFPHLRIRKANSVCLVKGLAGMATSSCTIFLKEYSSTGTNLLNSLEMALCTDTRSSGHKMQEEASHPGKQADAAILSPSPLGFLLASSFSLQTTLLCSTCRALELPHNCSHWHLYFKFLAESLAGPPELRYSAPVLSAGRGGREEVSCGVWKSPF